MTETLEARRPTEATTPPERQNNPHPSEIGPDRPEDLRTLRPYFLVSLLQDTSARDQERTIERIGAWTAHEEHGAPVTDLFIFAHGWHENFFRALDVYDRLCSRALRLIYSHRVPTEPRFRSLFLNLHYRSDPGPDNWQDRCGRREKESFLRKAAELFEPNGGEACDRFTSDFEEIFARFTFTANPQVRAPAGQLAGEDPGFEVLDRLKHYRLRESPGARLPDLMAAAWACYHTADPEPALENQHARRTSFLPPWVALGVFGSFLAAALKPLKLGAVAVLLVYLFRHRIAGWFSAGWNAVNAPFQGGPLRMLGSEGKVILLLIAVLSLVSWGVLLAAPHLQRKRSSDHHPSPLVILSWAILQFVLTVPLVIYCVFSFLLGGITPHPWLYDERIGRRNEDPDKGKHHAPFYAMAQVAQYPSTVLRRTAGSQSKAHEIADKVDAQLSFWLMQRRSVEAGAQGAEFLAELLARVPELSNARIHLIGHSFGVLIVSNLVRHLALSNRLQQKIHGRFPGKVDSVCLLGAAFATDWFRGEPRVRDAIRRLGCVYSRYDTACGFYYPFSNHGRVAAGSVGLSGEFPTEEHGGYIVLAGPPAFGPGPGGDHSRIFNIDASQILYRGKDVPHSDPKDVFKAGGGGSHDDIFNDDALYLFWSVTGIGQDLCAGEMQTVD